MCSNIFQPLGKLIDLPTIMLGTIGDGLINECEPFIFFQTVRIAYYLIEAPFASLNKQAETLFRLICCERKTLFQLKKQAEKYRL